MKILQVMAGAKQGGAETAFIDTCIAMKEDGFEIEVATRANPRNLRLVESGIKVHELPFGGALDLLTTFRLKKIIAGYKPEIVQTWMARAAQKTPADPKRYFKVSRLGGYYALKYFKTTDYFMTITPDIKTYLIREGIEENRIVHINNFAETETGGKTITKQDLDTPEQAIAVLALSRLHDSKALDILIKAVVPLENMHLWLAGEGPLRGGLEKLAQDLGIAKRVHFLGWRDDRDALLKACDICVFPSRYEPFGTVFVQAWGAGRPVIVSTAQGPSQYVRDGEDALVFKIDEVPELTEALEKLSTNYTLREKLVKNGLARYAQEFTKARTMKAYHEFYEEILTRDNLMRNKVSNVIVNKITAPN